MTRKLLLALLIVGLGTMIIASSLTQLLLASICGPIDKTSCDPSVYAGAVIAVVITTAAIVGTCIIAWLLFRVQSGLDDERHKKQNERLDRIEDKIDKNSGRDVDKKPDED